MQIKEAIVLAGGFGTRLKSVVHEVPKPMAPIGARPFLELVLDHCFNYNIERIVLAVGYKHEIIKAHFGTSYRGMHLDYSIEKEPLGTGGGILQAIKMCQTDSVVILNGDTLFKTNLAQLGQFFYDKEADLALALCSMKEFDRYGTVEIVDEQKITAFKEKTYQKEGHINAGVYILNKQILLQTGLKGRFSFEKDFMEGYVDKLRFYGRTSADYFIDIGIPEDYKKAQKDLL